MGNQALWSSAAIRRVQSIIQRAGAWQQAKRGAFAWMLRPRDTPAEALHDADVLRIDGADVVLDDFDVGIVLIRGTRELAGDMGADFRFLAGAAEILLEDGRRADADAVADRVAVVDSLDKPVGGWQFAA